MGHSLLGHFVHIKLTSKYKCGMNMGVKHSASPISQDSYDTVEYRGTIFLISISFFSFSILSPLFDDFPIGARIVKPSQGGLFCNF
ncbi:hypothetical protein K1719_010141 [Acacia pycnantha]|nr:hypothetical protein K1719_010141 [Acacia pycnantha]